MSSFRTNQASCRAAVGSVAAILLAATLALPAHAAVTRIKIQKRLPYAEGKSFDGVGRYERLLGRVYFEVDPAHMANRRVVDVELAPRNGRGLVEFSTDLEILAPADLSRASGMLLYDVNNRGKRMALGLFNTDADHFLMRRGDIVVWSGWLADLLPHDESTAIQDRLLRLEVPIATQEGRTITGTVRAEVMLDEPAERANLSGRDWIGAYRPTADGLERATLTWRLHESDPRVPIPREQWRLDVQDTKATGEQSSLPRIDLVVSGGLQPGYIYELIYEAREPIVQGLALAGIRDLVSFLKHDASEKNPLLLDRRASVPACPGPDAGDGGAGIGEKRDASPTGKGAAVRRTIGFGISQSGRCLRVLLHQGFNADEEGRQVFDGLIPHVPGGGLGFFNHRFAQPSRYASQHADHLFPCDMFPFAYETQRDPLSGREDGILRRARADGVVPKIFHVQTSAEYWHRSGSLVHTDPLGKRDADLPDEVRLYAIGGAQHGPGNDTPGKPTDGQLPNNPTDYRPALRALLVALDRWIAEGVEPPPSRYPRIADGTLVEWRGEKSGWKPLPGVRYPEVIQQPSLLDYGPEFHTQGRLTQHPPRPLGEYRVLVPLFDGDDNEQGVLRLPSIAVPVATYTGWNLRSADVGAQNELMRLLGSYIALRPTRAERIAAGDPRPALLERYGSFEDYLSQFEAAARSLVENRYLLAEDAERLLERARKNRRLFEDGR